MNNLQDTVFFNPGGRRLNDILQRSRVSWLGAEDIQNLFEFYDAFLHSGDGSDITANTEGLFKITARRFTDNNPNWLLVNNQTGQRVITNVLRSGALTFNYTESRMLPANGTVFTKRVIRRSLLYPGFTLVHYLRTLP